MDLRYFTNQSNGEYEILISGVVGEKIDGDQVAAEIKYLNEIEATVIKERINSVGGGIINGMSIISANLQSKAEIHTINEGMAGSIASLILATGTPGKRSGFDFSLGVIHNPSLNGMSLEDMPEGKDKEETLKFKKSLIDIYVNNTKLTRSEATALMNEDVLLSSKELKEKGLIDNIIPSKMKPIISKNMAYSDIMNVCSNIEEFINHLSNEKDLNTNKNNQKMSNLTRFYNLSDEATEDSILSEAKKQRSELELVKNQVKALKEDDEKKDKEIADLKSENDTYKNEAIETYVDSVIETGRFLKENKESILENAKNIGLDAFKTFVDNMPVKAVNVLDKITNQTSDGGDKKTKDQKLAEEYEDLAKNDKEELKRIKNEDPARFEKMLDAWNKN